MNRRAFLHSTALTAAAASTLPAQIVSRVIDTNTYFGEWPFRDLPAHLMPIPDAWVGSFEALLHTDLDRVNAALATAGSKRPGWLGFGAVNPRNPGWRETLRRIHEVHRFPGIRLHPNYHDYTLGSAEFRELLAAARERKLVVQIVGRMEDPRTQHPKLSAPDVDFAPLVETLEALTGAKVQILNGLTTPRANLLWARLGKLGVVLDLAMLEGMEGVRAFLDANPGVPLAYGSHAPFFIAEAAALKMQESTMTAEERAAIHSGHALKLLA